MASFDEGHTAVCSGELHLAMDRIQAVIEEQTSDESPDTGLDVVWEAGGEFVSG